jgi:hypothetical protein
MTNQQNRRLLVPMNIEALVVGDTSNKSYVDLKPDFSNILSGRFTGQEMEREPFASSIKNLHSPGIHLHWALPDGLAHGTKETGEELKFPLIPNRWLIARLWDQEASSGAALPVGSTKPDLKCRSWILESDTTVDKGIPREEKGMSYPRLRRKNPTKPAEYEDVYIGRRFNLDQWGEGSQPSDSIDITALGYGDPAFSGYYPACRNILGFWDDPEDLKNVALAYFVVGWYSAPSKDPLHQATANTAQGKIFDALDNFLKEKQWTYPGFAETLAKAKEAEALEVDLKERREMEQRLNASSSDIKGELQREIAAMKERQQPLANELKSLEKSLPSEIICHGTISGIQWKTKTTPYASGIPGNEAKISLGNTQIDALGALFENNGTDLTDEFIRLLQTFQYDLLSELEKPGGEDLVDQKIHERAYRPKTSGIRWNVIEKEKAQLSRRADEKTPSIPGDLWMLLEKVNARQRLINRLKRERDSASSQLYAIWYATVLEEYGISDQQVADCEREVDRLTHEITALEDQLQGRPKGSEWDELQASLKSFLPDFELQQQEELRFWRPNDPVVLLAGPPFKRSLRHGEDGRYRPDGRLLCRLSGQEITRIKVAVSKNEISEFGPEELDIWCDPFTPTTPSIPSECVDLFREFLFLTLDGKRAYSVATAAYEKIEPGLAANHQTDVAALASNLIRWQDTNFRDSFVPVLEDSQLPGKSETFAVGGDDAMIPSPVGKTRWEKNPWLPLFLQWEATWEPSYSDTSHALKNWFLNENGTSFEWQENTTGNSQIYKGTVLLTAGVSIHFSERLRQYNRTHDNEGLRKLQTAVRSLNILCQSLGGFTENLLTRRARLELRPVEPGDKNLPILESVFDRVKDVDWLSPLTDQPFLPIRAGHLTLKRLRVIDAFGQIFAPDLKSIGGICRPGQLSGPGDSLRLEPRLAQPARLTMQWLPARDNEAEEFSPVCGWILPNFLDKSLMIYDAEGNGLGALQGVKRKSWEQGAGGAHPEIEGFHWVGFPGSRSFFFGKPTVEDPDPLGPTANPHLRAFVKSLLSLTRQSGDAFSGLLDKMNQAISVTGGDGSAQDPNIALLMGKPLALVRCSIALELDGSPALSQNEEDLKKTLADRTGGIEKVRFPVRLGDRRDWKGVWLGEDGLVGFFQNQNYSRFYPAYGLTGRKDDGYSYYSTVPELSTTEPLDLTLLMDPTRGVSATMGILPRQLFEFPYGSIAETLETKHIIFFTGPVLSPRSAGEKAEIRMPHPSDLYGQWSWTHHPAVEMWREATIADTQREQGYFPDVPLEISEGWLKLVAAPLTLRVFTVKGSNAVPKDDKQENRNLRPEEFQVSPGEVILSWEATGADEIELLQDRSSFFKSHRHPLPTQYVVHVDRDTLFTLVATVRPDKLSEATAAPAKQEKKISLKLK